MMNITDSIFNRYLNLFKTQMGLNLHTTFSIFQYSNEFKEFLNENSDNLSTISAISIPNFLNEDIFEKLQNVAEENNIEAEAFIKDGENDAETSAEESSNFFANFLLELFKDEKFANSVDKNQNGKTDKEELEGFLNAIDGDTNSELTLEELFNGLESIKDGTLEDTVADNEPTQPEEPTHPEEPTKPEEPTQPEEPTHPEKPTKPEAPAAPNGTTQSGGSVGGSTGSTPSAQPNPPSQPSPPSQPTQPTAPTQPAAPSDTSSKSLNDMSVEELNQERTSRNTNLENAKKALNDVFSGNNKNIKEAQDNLNKEKEAYETALNNDENISEDLKYKQRAYSKAISKDENNISELKTKINNKNSEIYSTQSLINQASKNDEKDKKAEYEKQLENLQSELNDYNKELETENEDLKEIKEILAGIEDEIAQNCGEETTKALESYTQARDNLDSVKQTEEAAAQKAIQDAQNSIAEVDNALESKMAEDKNKPQAENVNLTAQYLTDENSKMSYLLIGPENPDPNIEYPVMVFLSGEAQHGAGEKGLYADTTPAGVMQNWDLENFNGYVIIPSQPAAMENWYNNKATNGVKSILDNLKSKQKTGKTVIVGASSGAPGAGYMASKLGKDYFDEAVCIAGYPYGNIEINMPISYYYGSEDERAGNIEKHVNDSNIKGNLIKIEGANHNDVVKALLTEDSNNDKKSDFLQKLFGNK